MKQLLALLAIWIPIVGQAQKNLTVIELPDLHQNVVYKGGLVSAVQWSDTLGVNYLVLAQSKVKKTQPAPEMSNKQATNNSHELLEPVLDTEVEAYDKELYAYHYVLTNDSIYLLWKLLDYERACSFDLTAAFLTAMPVVTDLDTNGLCETWVVYWFGCRSDMSALKMKLIMHQGRSKYAIRGTRRLKYGPDPNDVDGGEMSTDMNFKKLPKVVQDYAFDLWTKFNQEN